MATALEKKKYTYDDYLQTPEDKRFELIEGELVMTPSPATRHQRIVGALYYELRKIVMENKVGEVFFAPYDVYLDDQNVVQPDILFISRERSSIIGDRNVQGAPDLVVEIISESTAYRDLVQKKRLYAAFGVREYWVVDPGEQFVDVYTLKEGSYVAVKSLQKSDTLESSLLPGLQIVLDTIFSHQ